MLKTTTYALWFLSKIITILFFMSNFAKWLPQQTADWYMFMMGVAAFVSSCFLLWYLKYRLNKGVNPIAVFGVVFILTAIGFIGARVYSVLEDVVLHVIDGNRITTYPFYDKLANNGGFRFYGGVLFVVSFLLVCSKWFSIIKILELLDAFAITICIASILGRVGCQISGDGCYGTYTTLPWGMHYTNGVYPSLLPVHPVPIYEMIISFGLFVYLFRLEKQKQFAGQLFCLYLIFSSISRFLLEFIRNNTSIAFGLTFTQLTALLFIVLGTMLFTRLSKFLAH
jgi:phosphatidylglycerol:prolipoprotein diacylglycerol transferase